MSVFSSELQVQLVTDNETNKPRGYEFIAYTHTLDMKGLQWFDSCSDLLSCVVSDSCVPCSCMKQADAKKLDNRRVLVDVDRGRTGPN